MVIWKFDLEITDTQHVILPMDARLLSVGNQRGNLCLWAIVNPVKAMETRCIEIIGTGNPIEKLVGFHREFLGTIVIDPFVWHVFERQRA